jgi:hypothetical protein
MYDLLMVLIDESDLLTKAEALHTLALQLAHTDATYRGLSSVRDAQAYAAYVFPRCDELEAKLRRVISIGSP